jgi:hypothetical protein
MPSMSVKDYSMRLGIDLAKARRWSRELLGPDPKATRQSGFRRELTPGEAWEIYLGGILISDGKFLVHEAKTILRDLRPFLKKDLLYPGKETILDHLPEGEKGAKKSIPIEIHIQSFERRFERGRKVNGLCYEIRYYLQRRRVDRATNLGDPRRRTVEARYDVMELGLPDSYYERDLDEGGPDISINRSKVFVLNVFSEFVRYMALAEGVHLVWSLDFNF